VLGSRAGNFARQQLAALRSKESTGTKSAVGLSVAALGANVLGLAFTVVLARALGPIDYGSLAALVSAFLIVSIAGSALQITVAREVSVEASRHDRALRAHVLRWTTATLSITAVCVVLGIVFREELAALTGVDDAPWGAAAIPATGGVWLFLSVLRGALQGLQRFQAVALSIVGEAALRLVAAATLVAFGFGVTGGFLGSALSILLTAGILLVPLLRALSGPVEIELDPDDDLAPLAPVDVAKSNFGFVTLVRRTWPALVALTLIAILQNSDVIMVKRAADETLAGAYAADAVAAKVIVWIAIGLGFYVVPEAARRGAGPDARRLLRRAITLIAVLGSAMAAVYFVAGKQVLELAFGPEYGIESAALPLLGLAMVMLAITYLACQYFLAIRQLWFLAILAVGVVAQLVLVQSVADSPYDTAVAMLSIQSVVAAATVFASGALGMIARKPATGTSTTAR
jgi:O-antigen/teichoic acid export membrane protein